ncbi:type II toxin-antitoxin system PemK/MazF family toxin [Nostoc sp. TCL26-01]|uniref:type II toxin-antitoxin system PemK/MazF family toxin n=1 Tax=Nostoc sp. TCL26-01 TaxID=2576904 RepID=UPI0015BB5841|nr:type II toxin-antitoxin system PemK/MazF family toxin [Nostoc sp. TCL26-01]QLE58393.1 type II toxin-antitoxin system PemK/MazF family toxin [Nostoc sp. TCL26-01]
MTLSKGDIILTQFPFTDLSQTKLRPAVILWVDSIKDEITLCFISSQNVNNLTSEEFAILDSDPDFVKTGLRISSKVRVTRIATLNRLLVVRRLGQLTTQQIQKLNEIMIQAFQLL